MTSARRTIYWEFQSGPEGSPNLDTIDGPYAAETWHELKDQGRALLQSDRVPPEVVDSVNWYGLWNDHQGSVDSFRPVALAWSGRWLRVVPVSVQEYQEACDADDTYGRLLGHLQT